MLNPKELTGRADTHVTPVPGFAHRIHHGAAGPFEAMRVAAGREGIDIQPYSAFRGMAEQEAIWNAKFSGDRPLFDPRGAPRDYDSLNTEELIECILSWSALPGGSRHHWGTDIDIIDGAAKPADYDVQLLPAEYSADGVFSRLGAWLDAHVEEFGFFRPYATYRGGVNPEPWHISYAPVAAPALDALTVTLLTEAVAESNMLGKDIVLGQLDRIDRQYIRNVAPPPA